MKRLALNASPRGKKSNSRIILSWMEQGFDEGVSWEIADLSIASRLENHIDAFLAADEVVTVMPLYTDQAPGVFVRFIDALWDRIKTDPVRYGASLKAKRIGFIVQSGFPESRQSETLKKWLLRVCDRLGSHCLGVAVRGGIEGIQIMPDGYTKKVREVFQALGQAFSRGENFPPAVLDQLKKPEKLGLALKIGFTLLRPTGLMNFYWNMMLKKNGAYERRFDRPYA